MSQIKCFWMEAIGTSEHYSGMYARSDGLLSQNGDPKRIICGLTAKPHRTTKLIGIFASEERIPAIPMDKIEYPKQCVCGFKYTEGNAQDFLVAKPIYRRTDTEELVTIDHAPVGAMWDAAWRGASMKGPDGISLMVRTPGGDWCVDGQASNCTRPNDTTHKCWIREGVPPKVTAGKAGNTCEAGAGSIGIGSYHGFLRDGYLT